MTHIIILNWNGGRDTWLCLERVLAMKDVQITVFDNGSSDDSMDYIQAHLLSRNMPFAILREEDLPSKLPNIIINVILAFATENLGFAGAINKVIEPLLNTQTDYVWLLNNDAFPDKDTLLNLISKMQQGNKIGFVGSMILDANKKDTIQCAGVRYFKWLGVAKMLWKNCCSDDFRQDSVHMKSDFQHGASLLVSMAAIKATGLLDDRFFLYSEEHDWQVRGLLKGFTNCLCAESIVHHKGSMSTDRSRHLFFYYYCKSSVLFSRKHHAGATAVFASAALLMITTLRTRLKIRSMRWAIKGMMEAWQIKL